MKVRRRDVRKCNQFVQCFNPILFVFAVLMIASSSRAQTTYTWSGLGANNLWSTTNNWVSNVAPPSSSSTAIILTGTAQTTNVMNEGGLTLNSLTFASKAGPFTINQSGSDFFTCSPTTGGALPHVDQFSYSNQTINFPNTGLQLNSDLLLGGNGSGSLTINGQLAGGGGTHLVLNGPYAVTLNTTAANTIFGMVANAGALRLASDLAFPNGPFTFGGGTLQLINNLNLTRSIVINGGGGAIDANGFTAAMSNTSLTITGTGRLIFTNSTGTGASNIAGQLQQTGGLTVSGANNTVTLSGANNFYSGGTTISGGATLVIDTDTRLGNAANSITFDGGTLRFSAPTSFNTSRAIILGAGGGTIDVLSPQPAIGLAGAITGTGSLTKTGPGRIGLLAANTYSGLTNVNGGSLDIVHNQAAQNSTINLNGGAMGFFSPASAPVLGGLSGSSNLAFGGSLTTLSVGNNNASTTYSGNLSGSLPSGLTKIGTGTWTLSGNNSQSGLFNIAAGSIVLGSATAVSPNSTINLSSGAILDLNGFTCIPGPGASNFSGTIRMQFGSIVDNPSSNIT